VSYPARLRASAIVRDDGPSSRSVAALVLTRGAPPSQYVGNVAASVTGVLAIVSWSGARGSG